MCNLPVLTDRFHLDQQVLSFFPNENQIALETTYQTFKRNLETFNYASIENFSSKIKGLSFYAVYLYMCVYVWATATANTICTTKHTNLINGL